MEQQPDGNIGQGLLYGMGISAAMWFCIYLIGQWLIGKLS